MNRRALLFVLASALFLEIGCATSQWAKTDPWEEYPPPSGWEGRGRYASGYWWMPSKMGLPEYGNRGVIFYAGDETVAPVAPVAPVAFEQPAPKIQTVEYIVYKPVAVKKEIAANRYIFPTITFAHGSSEVLASSMQFDEQMAEITSAPMQIQDVAELIKGAKSDMVLVEGHIDAAEKQQYPALGLTRAEAVKAILVELGVNPDVLKPVNNADTRPICGSNNEICRSLNRRVTFTVIPRGQSLEPETVVQPPRPAAGPNIKLVERVVEKQVAVPELVYTDHFIFPHINFEYDKSQLTPQGLQRTQKAGEIIKAVEGIRKITVEGHADWRGSDAYNDALSLRRAQEVRGKLVNIGVPATTLEAVGYGEQKPLASNETPLGMALNRRVEFTLEYR